MTHDQIETILDDVFAKHGFTERGIIRRSMADITKAVSRAYNVSVERIRGGRGSKATTDARFEAYAACYDEGWTSQDVAEYMNRHHTTILHGIRRFEGQ